MRTSVVDMKFIFWYLIAINVFTFLVMLIDKIQASQHARRVRERTLYILTFLGGSPAMLLSMRTLRHKNRKLSFQLVVWCLLLLQVVLMVFFLDPSFVHLPKGL